MKEHIKEKLAILEGVEVKLDNGLFEITSSKGTVKRRFTGKNVELRLENKTIILESKNATKREKKLIKTFKAHLKNMIKGVLEGFTYKLKICASHFPMNVSVSGEELIVKNFLGEKIPRTLKIKTETKIKIDGQEVIVEGNNKELVGQQAASIEQLCRITNRDRRIFQDGIFIIEKAGKKIK